MNAFILFAGSGPLVVLTSHASIEDPELLDKLAAKGIDKFLAYNIPLALAKARYGLHFDIVARGLSETDDHGVLDFDGVPGLPPVQFHRNNRPIYLRAPMLACVGLPAIG